MRTGLHRVVLAVLVGICTLAISGCFIDRNASGKINGSTGQGVVLGSVVTAVCFDEPRDGGGTFVSCFVKVPGLETAAEYLAFFGGGSLNLFLDPLLVQFPANVSSFSGTFTGTVSGALAIQSGLSCVNTVPGEQLCAESGQQLVVLDFPAGTPIGAYDVTLNFTVTPPAAIIVKPVITGKVVAGGQTFYPLLVPCVTSFASVPSLTIPVSSTLVGIPVNTSGVTACTGRTIDFRELAQAIPTLAQPAYFALALLMALFAVYFLGMRRRRA